MIQSVLGRGGVGTVYRAKHRRSGRAAAVKVLGPAPVLDGNAARRLAREYEVLRRLDHPNVVRVFDTGVHDGWSWLAMELVEGLDLRTWLSPTLDDDEPLVRLDGVMERDAPSASGPSVTAPAGPSGSSDGSAVPGPDALRALAQMLDEPDTQPERDFHLPRPDTGSGAPCARLPLPPEASLVLNRPARIRRLTAAVSQVLAALGYVHRRGLVHRDLKPTNIMVDDQRRARIMDFGLVKPLDSDEATLTGTGKIVGTYRYMSPEQVQGKLVDERSDLYSLGVILYELLAARPPFMARDPSELWREILSERPPPLASVNPEADPGLARITDRLLEKDPARRFRSAEDVLAALS
ncbi:MAG TPA: serine/threonine-protein kinase [Anaeromyxobacteraceae bacterium]|nr:serine/threonine-protein kinase [Anaeromyxobacteraceae bacterium]